MKSKILLSLFLIMVTFCTLPACKEHETQKTSIDVYILAGQSNAVGHTKISDRKALLKDMPALEKGYKVDNSKYMIMEYVNGAPVVHGTDKMHWSQEQMLRIGEDIGNIIINSIVDK